MGGGRDDVAFFDFEGEDPGGEGGEKEGLGGE